MVVDPVFGPTTLKRIWCAFEIYATIVGHAMFEIILIDTGSLATMRQGGAQGYGQILDKFSTMDVTKAKSRSQEDYDDHEHD